MLDRRTLAEKQKRIANVVLENDRQHQSMNDSGIDQDLDLFRSDEYEIRTTKLCDKDKLAQICDILGINCALLEMPKNGFTEQDIDTEVRALSRATETLQLDL